ncbi:hypothetical protein DFJ74DRAFT_663050 [Hyaloraphidium curvatum]|nr:hypothetical protein DFJ74DRAFT_663050 [Hyaloraphidium curvatum]
MNTAYNCLQRHVDEGRGDSVALIWDSAYTNARRRVTYSELNTMVDHFSHVLADHGVNKGDTVIIYMPMVVDAVVGMLACAKLGAVHSVVFGGFAPKELAKRLDDCQPKVILTASCGIEPSRVIPYLPLVHESFKHSAHAQANPPKIICLQRAQVPAVLDPAKKEIDWQAEVKRVKAEKRKPRKYAEMDSEDPLYVLYTSGTTGVPKGIVRENGGHAVALKWAMKHFMGAAPGEVVLAASDLGWVVGHTFICYAPLLNGCTSIIYEGKPVTPNPGAFWRIVEEHKASILFTAPTALRAVNREDPHGHYLRQHDISSLKVMFVAGERCDTDTANHFAQLLGVPVIDNWWQTETGWPIAGVCLGLEKTYGDLLSDITPAGHEPQPIPQVKIGSAGLPMPGFDIRVIDPKVDEHESLDVTHGQKLEYSECAAEEMGGIVVRLPLPPGVFRTLWKNPAGYQKSYLKRFDGFYDTTDAGLFDKNGYLMVMGRTDDIINVAGHRLSTGQMEEIVSEHPDVAECCVIGVADKLKGEKPLGFVVLKAGSDVSNEQITKELVRTIRAQIGAFACFDSVHVMAKLPKTRSGKILRKTIRSIVNNAKYDMPATIEDADVLKDFEKEFGYTA